MAQNSKKQSSRGYILSNVWAGGDITKTFSNQKLLKDEADHQKTKPIVGKHYLIVGLPSLQTLRKKWYTRRKSMALETSLCQNSIQKGRMRSKSSCKSVSSESQCFYTALIKATGQKDVATIRASKKIDGDSVGVGDWKLWQNSGATELGYLAKWPWDLHISSRLQSSRINIMHFSLSLYIVRRVDMWNLTVEISRCKNVDRNVPWVVQLSRCFAINCRLVSFEKLRI